MTDKRFSSVPRSRLSRFAQLGSLAGKVAGNVIAEGSKHWIRGKNPGLQQLLISPANARDLADKLSKMRGAAMKVGQMISMDTGGIIPKELATLLEKLRADADRMPPSQLMAVLEKEWGTGWDEKFSRFSFEPSAAASIGQVHKAVLASGETVAVKVQYPGVRESIDSDIRNVQGLLKMSGLLPKDLDLEPIIEEARIQLHREADYRLEGEYLQQYGELVNGNLGEAGFVVPGYFESHSTDSILCMSWQEGVPLEEALRTHPQWSDQIMAKLFELFFSELFVFKAVQTDPNLANYLLDTESQRIVLLDLGALRFYDDEFVARYRNALIAARDQNREQLNQALQELGFFASRKQSANQDVILDIFILAAEPLRFDGRYHFGRSDLAQRIHQRGLEVSSNPDAWHTPPPEVLFLHRKMAGLYLMAARLNAQVDVATLFESSVRSEFVSPV